MLATSTVTGASPYDDPMRTFVGGVGQLFQGDLDLGRLAVEQLVATGVPDHVLVEELHYGAVAVAQRLEDIELDALVLFGAVERGRGPGRVERRWVGSRDIDPGRAQTAIEQAVTGYVDIDLVLDVVSALGSLPPRTIVYEVEPATCEARTSLSPTARSALDRLLPALRDEIERMPVLRLADEARDHLDDHLAEPSSVVEGVRELLAELRRVEREGDWGAAFRVRDRLRLRISESGTGEGTDSLDRGLWWGLIEELDRVQSLDVHRPEW